MEQNQIVRLIEHASHSTALYRWPFAEVKQDASRQGYVSAKTTTIASMTEVLLLRLYGFFQRPFLSWCRGRGDSRRSDVHIACSVCTRWYVSHSFEGFLCLSGTAFAMSCCRCLVVFMLVYGMFNGSSKVMITPSHTWSIGTA